MSATLYTNPPSREILSRNGGHRRSRSAGRSAPAVSRSRDLVQEVYDRMGVSKQSLDASASTSGRSPSRLRHAGETTAQTVGQHQRGRELAISGDEEPRRARSLSRGKMQDRWSKIVSRDQPTTPSTAMYQSNTDNNYSNVDDTNTATNTIDAINNNHNSYYETTLSSEVPSAATREYQVPRAEISATLPASHAGSFSQPRLHNTYLTDQVPAFEVSTPARHNISASMTKSRPSQPGKLGGPIGYDEKKEEEHSSSSDKESNSNNESNDAQVASSVSIRDRINAFSPSRPIPRYSRRSFGARCTENLLPKVSVYPAKNDMDSTRQSSIGIIMRPSTDETEPTFSMGPPSVTSITTSSQAGFQPTKISTNATKENDVSPFKTNAQLFQRSKTSVNSSAPSANSVSSRSTKSSANVANAFLAAIQSPVGTGTQSPIRSSVQVPAIVIEEGPNTADNYSVAASTISGMPEDSAVHWSPGKRQVVCGVPGGKSAPSMQERYNAYASGRSLNSQDNIERQIDERVKAHTSELEARFDKKFRELHATFEDKYRAKIDSLEDKTTELTKLLKALTDSNT